MARGFILAGTVLLTMSALPATSGQTQYFMGDVWGVWQVLPEGEDADPEEKPHCLFGTRTWPQKGLNVMYVLTSADYVEPWLQIYSTGWELPVGKKTKVDLVTVAGPLGFELEATSASYLTASIDPKIVGKDKSFAFEVALSYMLDSRRTGINMRVKFAGSEPEWFIPAMDQLEAYQLNAAFRKCIGELRSKGGDFYSGRQTPDGKTSPFAE
ncbi:hypothetical protein [Neorhizobium alkalisoli]|uniref:hypothetical protein n=1 Tax=Neorhizobium alkalisoli TaxID=528178 RepID=UPI000CF95FB1|nr:hypothetical protein [Neorhizobium alkalisoli]